MKRTVVNFEESKTELEWDSDKIVINTGTDENLLWWTRKSLKAYSLYVSLLEHDFVLYMHKKQQSFFIKRGLVNTIWKRKDLIQGGQTFYSVEKPLKRNNLASNGLVVIFSSMPPEQEYFSAKLANRTFAKNYPSMQKHLIKNVFILRIMDLNISSGSYYLNAGHYKTFEEDVQAIIQNVRNKYDISKEHTVLYGSSKGGCGALYHSILGDYHAMVVDPIFSLTKYNEDNNLHFLQGILPEKLLPKFKQTLEQNEQSRKKVILGSSRVPENFQEYSKISNPMIQVVNLQDDNIRDHISIALNCVAEQITYINDFLMEIPMEK